MQLRSGIPRLDELAKYLEGDAYQQHVAFNQRFLADNDAAMEKYGKLWAKDTFRLWSRRWEYPFAFERIEAFAREDGARPLRVLDAGSGVTYFPYYLCDRISRAVVTCLDSNPAYHAMFAAINAANPAARVRFVEAMLQKMPLESGSFDAIACISVLEHTSNYGEILDEFARVLRPGGLLVLTFDLSLDGRFELPQATAAELLGALARRFDAGAADLVRELDAMDEPEKSAILTTDYIRRTQPDLLPWKFPLLQAAHDLAKGRGWTGGFRSKSVYCLDVKRRV